jgi:AbrB family looped-hinge helix DNA binding protein
MNAQTKLSAKGQIVIPKDMRERLGLAVGETFDVTDRGGDIVLRPLRSRKNSLTVEEVAERLRKIVNYDGPYITDEMINEAAAQGAAGRTHRLDAK